jgi:tight adherence protein B
VVHVTALAAAVVAALVLAIGFAAPPAPRRAAPGAPSPTFTAAAVARGWVHAGLERAQPTRRGRRRDGQLPAALDRLASSLRAGLAVGPAVIELAATVDEPLAGDLRPVRDALVHGTPAIEALAAWGQRSGGSADVRLVVAALTLGAQAGGEVARAVDRIAGTLRERREVQAEVHALATQARASACLLAVAPLAFAGLVATIEPRAVVFLVTDPIGLGCLLLGVGLDALGAAWMHRITRSET